MAGMLKSSISGGIFYGGQKLEISPAYHILNKGGI